MLLDGHTKDEKVIGEVEGFLRGHKIPTYVHRPQGDLRRDTERLTETCEQSAPSWSAKARCASWVSSRLDEAFKADFKTTCPLQLFCVYLAPPDKDLRPYERFKLLQDSFALLPNHQGPLEEGMFSPLFARLGLGRTA